jgi:transmembrane sensor
MNASIPDSLRIAALIRKQLREELSGEEKAELDHWIASNDDHQRLFAELNDAAMLQQEAASFARFDEEKALARFFEKNGHINPADIKQEPRTIGRWKWVAAAAVAMILAVGSYLWIPEKPVSAPLVKTPELKDVEPGRKGATLILANGTQVLLDSLRNGLVATQSGMNAILQNGELVYAPGKEGIGEMVYNTISVPNGRVFHLTLPDGTKVWINSASTIRYPVAFTGNQRQVEIAGEAYFDVVKNRKMPFRVRVENKAEIEVLGTQFNINAYENEETLNTTLLEGSVKLSARNAGPSGDQFSQVLMPGQQLQLSEKGAATIEPDLEKVIAWKNGLFNFDGVELRNAMKQIARWYDVEIVYKGKVPDVKFYGKISRDISLAGLIRGFEGSGVHMVIENGKQLVVMP